MQSITSHYRIVIDNLNRFFCSGWYVRLDEAEKTFSVKINNNEFMSVNPNKERKDVEDAGLGTKMCGFEFHFIQPLSVGDCLHFISSKGEILIETIIKGGLHQYKNKDMSIAAQVEPFIELDIAKSRLALIDKSLSDQWGRILFERFFQKKGQLFIDELINTFTEIYVDLQYLKAGFLTSTRASDADFNITTYKPQKSLVPSEMHIDMRGDITGANWYEPETDGRWAGPEIRSSLLIPSLKAGNYLFETVIIGEGRSGLVRECNIFINEKPISISYNTERLPFLISGHFSIAEDYFLPFWIIRFEFPETISPKDIDSSSKDGRKLAIRVSRVSITKEML